MDDFGSILERDYGLGRAGKGRIGSRSSKNSGNSSGAKFDSSSRFSDSGPRFDSSTRFSESFGRTKFGKGDLSGSFRGGGGGGAAWSDQQHGYARQESYGSSYSVYDEVFSCNVQSTIPVFEDVFRVPSSRMKVSELRDNDIFRGIPSLIKKSSNARVTYEDIFGEAVPDDLSAAVSLGGDAAGAKIATAASSRSNSGLGTPRKDAHPESTNDFPAQDLETKPSIQKPQGSFLGMSALKQNGHGIPQPVSNDEFERAWVSVGEVSLTTRPSEIPPPARLAPDRSRASNSSFDENSGPPPQRCPPPLSSQHNNNASTSTSNPNSNSSELLEKVLRERSAHAELSIREKVLDWQKHNLAQEEEQRRRSSSSPSSLPSSPNCATPERKSRAEALRKLREERETVERIAAEVEAAAAEQARVRAERAAMEDIDRDARAELLSKQQQQQDQNARDGGAASKVGEQDTSIRRGDDEGKVAETIAIEQETKNEAGANGNNVEEDSSSDAVATSTSTSTPVFREEDARSEAPRSSSGGIEQEDSTSSVEKDRSKQDEASGDARESPQVVEAAAKDQTTDTESVLSIDSFTTNQASASTPGSSRNAAAGTSAASAAAAKEEEAPETPERIESTVRDHEKSNKSSDISVEDRDRGASSDPEKKILLEEQQKRELMEEARRARERSLVARITAEVRERAALEAKAKAEKAAMDRKKSSPAIDQQQQQHRRTRPRLKEQSSIETAAKELEDRANSSGSSSSSSAIPKGGGSTRVSLRQQLEKERLARIAADAAAPAASAPAPATDDRSKPARDQQQESSAAAAKLREERTLVERMRAEARERAAMAKMEREREERERVERINAARQRERERMEKLEKEREKERERVAREMEREREIEREKDRVGLEHKAAQERAEAAEAAAAVDRLKMERAAVERANTEARARAERAAYDAAASARAPPRPTSVPKQRFGNSASMPSSGNQTENGGIRRTTSSTNLESDRSTSSNFSREDFKELKGETPERRKARLERYQRTLNRAAQALALKNKRDLELQTEQAERQRLAERLDSDIKRWSVGKDGNIRALLSTLQYVLWPESGWKQVSLTELINPTAVKKAYRRATLCVHPDKMQQKHASVQQKYIAEKVFHILQVAWNKFNSHETI